MCKECNEGEIQTKVCKICGEEKPVSEMNRQKNKLKSKNPNEFIYTCKVCDYLKRNEKIIIRKGWSIAEYKIILDSILNDKYDSIDNIVMQLNNKTLNDLVILLNNELHFKGGIHKIRVKYNCDNCGDILYLKISEYVNKKKKHFCSNKCNGEYYGIAKSKNKKLYERKCQYCGEIFYVTKDRVTRNKDKFCSRECSQKAQINKIKFKCDYCNIDCECTPSQYSKNKNHFCSSYCSDKYHSEISKEKRNCEICGTEFEAFKRTSQRFCSINCQIEWQRKYPKLGLDNKNFKSVLIKCDWCGKEYYEKPYKINSNQNNYFCSDKCRQDWYAKEFSQREEWKRECAERATSMITDGAFGKTETNIQLIINKVLNEISIKYDNEYNCKYVAIDNALFIKDKVLFVECMGTFWHTDIREYSNINYIIQKERIKLDKIKHSYIRDNYGVEILYLWEKDITKNEELCKQLILKYIENDGILENYHSFNYNLINDNLVLNNNIESAYMDYSAEEINKITNIVIKEKMSKKQEDKWTKYSCEQCGKMCEELTSHFIKKKHHFCSNECNHKFRNNKHTVVCNNCGENVKVIDSKFKKQKYFFCDKECQHEFQRREGFKTKRYKNRDDKNIIKKTTR